MSHVLEAMGVSKVEPPDQGDRGSLEMDGVNMFKRLNVLNVCSTC